MMWEIKYDDGAKERIEAERYDPARGCFLDAFGEPIAHINKTSVRIIKIMMKNGENSA